MSDYVNISIYRGKYGFTVSVPEAGDTPVVDVELVTPTPDDHMRIGPFDIGIVWAEAGKPVVTVTPDGISTPPRVDTA